MVTNALIEISTGRVMGENIFVEIKEGITREDSVKLDYEISQSLSEEC